MNKFTYFLFSILSIAAYNVQAGSFQLPTQGARQTAMGGSGTALPWDISSLYFNPGSLARLNGMEIQGNLYHLRPSVRYASSGIGTYYEDNIPQSSFPFAIYAGGKLKETDKWAFGLGVYTPFGSSLRWDDQWRGRYLNQNIALSTIFFQPTVAYAINPIISIGAGFIYGIGNMEINKALPLQGANEEAQANLRGKANGVGFTAGIQIQATEKYAIGLSYRKGPKMRINNGSATFSVPQSVSSMFPSTYFATAVNLPDNFTLGLAGKITPQLTVQADFIYSTWSNYHSLDVDFDQNTGLLQDASDPRQFSNTFAIRVGVNYTISNKLNLMIGGSYDPTPTSDKYLSPDAVDGNRMGVSGGIHYVINSQFNICIAAGYINVTPREAAYIPANFEGKYQIRSFSPALSLSYKF